MFNKKDSSYDPNRGKLYLEMLGYNLRRQDYLNRLTHSTSHDMNVFCEILGHPIDFSPYNKGEYHLALQDAIKEIAKKEGWNYCDKKALDADPIYRGIIGMAGRPGWISWEEYPDKILLSEEKLKEYRKIVSERNDTITSSSFRLLFLPSLLTFLCLFCIYSQEDSFEFCVFGCVVGLLNLISIIVLTCVDLAKGAKSDFLSGFLTVIIYPWLALGAISESLTKDGMFLYGEVNIAIFIFALILLVTHYVILVSKQPTDIGW